jgi:hypothetical protein
MKNASSSKARAPRAGLGRERAAVAVAVGEIEHDRAALADPDLAVLEERDLAALREAQSSGSSISALRGMTARVS